MTAEITDEPKPPRNRLDRALRVFGDVRGKEAPTVMLMTLNIFVVLVAYYVIKTVREPLILTLGGAELKAYAAGAQALVLIVFVPIYSYFDARTATTKLVFGLTIFFILCIEAFFVAYRLGVPMLGFAFFVWVGIFSVAVGAPVSRRAWSVSSITCPLVIDESCSPRYHCSMRVYLFRLSVLCVALAGGCGDDGSSGGSNLCSTFCERDAECFPNQQQPDCASWCAERLSSAQQVSAECLSAVEGTFGCVNGLASCGEVASWWNEEPADSYSCKSNDDAVNAACF